jgi:type II secretory pathway pseudopilin PulG
MKRVACGFTIFELLVVISIIIILAGFILATSAYVTKKGRRSRAEVEIAAISAALESYKADNGIYPTTSSTDSLKANAQGDPASYKNAGKDLYIQIAGDSDGDPTTIDTAKNYMGPSLKPNMLGPTPPGPNTYIKDPFGNCYGYSTVKASAPTGTDGFNPTFDLWSTGGVISPSVPDQTQWITNW